MKESSPESLLGLSLNDDNKTLKPRMDRNGILDDLNAKEKKREISFDGR